MARATLRRRFHGALRALPRFHGALRALRRFRAARGGVAAVEFALVVPVAIVLYVGAGVVTDLVTTSRRVDVVARTLVDLASKQSTSAQLLSLPAPGNAMTQAALQQLADGATMLIDPAPEAPLTLTLSAIDVFNLPAGVCCAAKVRWSFTKNGSLRPCNLVLASVDPSAITRLDSFSTAVLPVGTPLISPLSFLVADVTYAYQPVITTGYLQLNPTMRRTEYMMPRSPGQVIATGLTAPPGTGPGSGGQVCY